MTAELPCHERRRVLVGLTGNGVAAKGKLEGFVIVRKVAIRTFAGCEAYHDIDMSAFGFGQNDVKAAQHLLVVASQRVGMALSTQTDTHHIDTQILQAVEIGFELLSACFVIVAQHQRRLGHCDADKVGRLAWIFGEEKSTVTDCDEIVGPQGRGEQRAERE